MQDQPTTPPVTPSPIYDTPEAAEYVGAKPTTLEQWRWQGLGPRFVKIGRLCRYRQKDLDAFIEERVFSSTTEAQAAKRKRRCNP